MFSLFLQTLANYFVCKEANIQLINTSYQNKFILIIILMSQISIQPKENRTTNYTNIIKIHNNDEFFSQRVIQLKGISSYHMFPIDAAAIGDYPMIIYLQESLYTLQDIIQNKIELSPNNLKALIWQITKLMLDCQGLKINHLRLYPKAIVFNQKFKPIRPFFIRVKDFSLGKQFDSVKQGKIQQIFEYLHPDLSILNKIFNFGKSYPQYDIWSLGIILYKLIHFKHPFCKSGKSIFSKTILRQYLESQYQIKYPKKNYESINKFIEKCLTGRAINQFGNWQQIKRYILEQQEIYHQLDFHDGFFEQMAQIHLKSMIFFSMMHCMIIDECKESPNPFWRIPISNEKKVPFQILICQFTLTFMRALQQRFHSIYSTHFFLLKQQTIKDLLFVSEHLKNQLDFKHQWFGNQLESNQLTKETLLAIQDVCVRTKLQASEQNQKIEMGRNSINGPFKSSRIQELRSAIVKKKKSQPYASKLANSKKVWKTVQILYDYCSQVLDIVRQNKQKTKYAYEQLYINSIFDAILVEEFNYKKDLSLVFKKIYKSYLN